MPDQPHFTNSWFDINARNVWDWVIPQIDPTTILEVGSYEGASVCYLIDKLGRNKDLDIHCVDTWAGGLEHAGYDMHAVERRFDENVDRARSQVNKNIRIAKHKGTSDIELSRLLVSGKSNYFDFVFIDGSHQAPDVLCDAILSFRLLRTRGVMCFDDYLWKESLPYGQDLLRCPKPAIDAFTNLYCRKLEIMSVPRLYQLFIQKISD